MPTRTPVIPLPAQDAVMQLPTNSPVPRPLALPPMPWMDLNQMVESDARALFRYIAFLGAAGEVMPAALPPDVEPTTPYHSLVPVEPGS